MVCQWTRDSDNLVMEIPSGRGKSTQDSEPACICRIMIELEESGLVDVTLNGHVVTRVPHDDETHCILA